MSTCPVCRGDGRRHDHWTGTVDEARKCPACRGIGTAPKGCRMDDDTRAKQAKGHLAGKHPERRYVNGSAVWEPEEDAMAVTLETLWRELARNTGKARRPNRWLEDAAEKIHAACPRSPLRTRNAVKQRIIRLMPERED